MCTIWVLLGIDSGCYDPQPTGKVVYYAWNEPIHGMVWNGINDIWLRKCEKPIVTN